MTKEIVISGIAGRFPASNNVREYRDNLLNKVNMIGGDSERWNVPSDVAKNFGFMKNVDKFDPKPFNVHPGGVDFIDPQGRIMLEHVHEALIDAGVSPETIRGTNTGVYVGSLVLDTMDRPLAGKNDTYGFSALGYAKFSFANRVSFTFDLTGPSMLVDTACSSSFYALTLAFEAIKKGDCESALVIGTALIFSPYIIESMQKSKIINSEGKSQPFDKNASGYVRGESVSVVYLQKKQDAKRIYASIVNSKINNEGFKTEGQTVPSIDSQMKLYRSVYECDDNNIDVNSIDFLEAHTTSTQAGDKQEITSVDRYFCRNRETPLKIGSVKGNIGHAEGASGLASLIKTILMFENEKIIPNINIHELRDDCPALQENRIEVVQEVEKFDGKIISVNNFGLLGSNAHAIFKRHEKTKTDDGFPSDKIPRLLTWSGRTDEAVNTIFNKIAEQPLDDEFLALLQASQSKTSSAMNMRGYAIFKSVDDRSTTVVDRQIKDSGVSKRPIVFVFSGVGSQWLEMGTDLMKIPFFADKFKECHEICNKININLIEMLTSKDAKDFKLWYPVAVTAIQIVLTDLLKRVGVEPNFIVGHSLGEIACAYADETLSKEEALLTSFYRGYCLFEEFFDNKITIGGGMAAIGLNHGKIRGMIPADSGIEIACHNSADSCTVSGLMGPIKDFVKQLNDNKIFAVVIESEGIPYHSSYIQCIEKNVLKYLRDTIKTPKLRSKKWMSSSVPKSAWDSELAKYSSAEYHTNNMMSAVLFEEALEELPEDSYMIEIAPHGLFQSILRKSFPKAELGSLMKKNSPDGVTFLLQSLGKIFQNGIDLDIRQLYPKVEFPVSRSTEMISPLVKWDHSASFFVPSYESQNSSDSKNIITISLRDPKYEYFKGHVIDGKILLPATGYLFIVWEVFAKMHGFDELKTPFVCENIKFMRPTILSMDFETNLIVSVQKATGRFEVLDSKGLVVEGEIREAIQETFLVKLEDVEITEKEKENCFLTGDDFYRELALRGFGYNGEFRSISKIVNFSDGSEGAKFYVRNTPHLVAVMDNIIHMGILFRDSREQMIPTGLRKFYVNFEMHNKFLEETIQEAIINGENEDEIMIPAYSNNILNSGRCGGVEMVGLARRFVARKKVDYNPVLETFEFVSHFPTPKMSLRDAAKIAFEILLDKTMLLNVKAVEIDNKSGRQPIIEKLTEVINSFPMVSADSHYLTDQDELEMKDVNVTKDSISAYSQIDMCIISDSIEGENLMRDIMKMQENGVALMREKKFIENLTLPIFISCAAIIPLENDWIYVLKKAPSNLKPKKTFEIPSELNVNWMKGIKEVLASDENPVVLYSKKGCSGILGFFNCLKREMSKKQLQCVLIDDESAPEFDIENVFYKNQLDLGLTVNVYKNGQWGSYHHLSFSTEAFEKEQNGHCFAHQLEAGDLSSLTWVTGELNPLKDNLVNVQYSGLNFRDVMVSSSRISLDFEFQNRVKRQYQLGFEFSGTRKDGSRVMGITTSRAFSNFVSEDEALLLDVPSNWTLEESATVPLVYITVYYAFFVCTHIERGKSILIHAGSGGLGIAAIRVALSYGLEVFTTVSTEAKKQYLLSEFPDLKSENIGNSRDTSFEGLVMKRTKTIGVDYVLNSLSEAKMQATVRCLAENGVFLEVGKFDMLMGNRISLEIFLRGIEFKAVLINTKMISSKPHVKSFLTEAINKDIKAGIIKPLKTTVFKAHDIEKSFRYIATAKHTGKILIKIRESEESKSMLPISAKPRTYFDSDKSYIITGGLGGMGMELADWMILRKCKKLILSSSRGLSNDYQKYRIHRVWETYDVKVVISTSDITTKSGCEELIREAMKLGPVGGIFNLAGITSDGLFDKMTEETFEKVLLPKSYSTYYLDEISRNVCPELDHFLAFSSIACGYGNGGQTNYGYANSMLERIVEKRRSDGLPGKAIQWGPVAEVGMMAKRGGNLEAYGLVSQDVASCLSLLDDMIAHESAVVSSYVKKETKKISKNVDSVFNHVISILGISNTRAKGTDLDVPLSEYGLDSLTGAELEVMLERELGVTLKLQELRSKSINQIRAQVLEMVNGSNNNQ